MQVAAPAELQSGPELRAQLLYVLLRVLQAAFMRNVVLTSAARHLRSAGDELLSNVRRIPHHGVQLRQGDAPLLHAGPPLRVNRPARDEAERVPTLGDLKEVPTGNEGVVLLVLDVARGQVERRQVGGKDGDVTAEDLLEQFLMALFAVLVSSASPSLLGEPGLAMVGSDEETAGPASRVQNDVARPPNAEGVDDVDNVLVGVVLPELLALFRRDEPLKDPADNVVGDLPEVVLVQVHEEARPSLSRAGGGEDERPGPFIHVGIEDGFVIPGLKNRLVKLEQYRGKRKPEIVTDFFDGTFEFQGRDYPSRQELDKALVAFGGEVIVVANLSRFYKGPKAPTSGAADAD